MPRLDWDGVVVVNLRILFVFAFFSFLFINYFTYKRGTIKLC